MNVQVRLAFPDELVGQPIVAQLVKRFDVEPNILTANVGADEGWIVCDLSGDPAAVEGALAWLTEIGASVERLGGTKSG
ncbi:MAG: NIL domain-containing protein [Acidimicrobiales bacterium]|jgi:D-methionine transport system ATP-binding protein